jgi:hypothetical protein
VATLWIQFIDAVKGIFSRLRAWSSMPPFLDKEAIADAKVLSALSPEELRDVLHWRSEFESLAIDSQKLDQLIITRQECIPKNFAFDEEGIYLTEETLHQGIELLLRFSVQQKSMYGRLLFMFVEKTCFSASLEFANLDPERIGSDLNDDFWLFTEVKRKYHSDKVIYPAALALIQASDINLMRNPKEQEVLIYFETRGTQVGVHLDNPLSTRFDSR